MKVLMVNTADRTGGAAIAAYRLMEALMNNGVKVQMLVRDKTSVQPTVSPLAISPLCLKFKFLWERAVIWAANGFRRYHLFDVDIANTGTDITSLPEFRQADVIHLHWVNQGFLSLKDLRRITDSGKPVVWTLHDMWPFTGICHYAGGCGRYREGCYCCPMLYGGGSKHDLSSRVFRKKQRWMQSSGITFVACSNWLADLARSSLLLQGKRITSIPNTISANLYRPADKAESRRRCGLPSGRQLILFSAFKTTNPIKGLAYLQEACRILAAEHPETKEQMAVVAVGKASEDMKDSFPFAFYPMGYITDEHKLNCALSALKYLLSNKQIFLEYYYTVTYVAIFYLAYLFIDNYNNPQNGWREKADLYFNIFSVIREPRIEEKMKAIGIDIDKFPKSKFSSSTEDEIAANCVKEFLDKVDFTYIFENKDIAGIFR